MTFLYQLSNRQWTEEHPDTLAATLRCADLQIIHSDCCPGRVVYFRRADLPGGDLTTTGYSARWLTDQELNP